jgi:hypothetical protein
MDQIPLVKEEIDAGKAFIREFTKYAPVSVALWVKESGDELHYLYIASDQIHDTNVRQGYGEVMRIAQSLASPYLDPFRINLVSADSPRAAAAREINERFPARYATRLGGSVLGGVGVDDVYVYPPEPCPISN